MTYRVEIQPRALRQLRKLDHTVRSRLLRAAEKLADDPRPAGCLKLSGGESEYRLRVGEYRIIYAIEDDRLLVLVLAAGHRKDVYEKWERSR